MNVQFIKLVSGDDVIAEVVEEEGVSYENHITIRNPLKCVVLPDGNTAITPWLLGSEESIGIDINKSHVMCMTTPASALLDIYHERYGLLMVAPELTGLEL